MKGGQKWQLQTVMFRMVKSWITQTLPGQQSHITRLLRLPANRQDLCRCRGNVNGATGGLYTEGVFEIAAVNNAAFVFGDILYWDSVAGKLTKTSTGDGKFYAGRCAEAKAETGTVAKVKLGEMGDIDGPST